MEATNRHAGGPGVAVPTEVVTVPTERELSEEERSAWIKSLDERLAEKSLGGHWQHRERAVPLAPHLWRWNDIFDGVLESGEVVRLGDDTNRRTVQLRNPTSDSRTSRTLQMSIQLVKPGERATAHRHTAAAIRFIVSGHGAYTTVEGERMMMEPNDFIITPGWTFHDHTNETEEPVVWLDGLDTTLLGHLDAMFTEQYPGLQQPITKPDGASPLEVGAVRSRRPDVNTWPYPPFRYAWSETSLALQHLSELPPEEGDDPYDGVLLEYTNPLDGGHTLPTISCRIQLIRSGSMTKAHRHTGTTIYHAVEGSGTAWIDGKSYEWGPRDCFFIPSWCPHYFENASTDTPTILFSMTDIPVLEALRLYREQED